jgi:hypothetical protein
MCASGDLLLNLNRWDTGVRQYVAILSIHRCRKRALGKGAQSPESVQKASRALPAITQSLSPDRLCLVPAAHPLAAQEGRMRSCPYKPWYLSSMCDARVGRSGCDGTRYSRDCACAMRDRVMKSMLERGLYCTCQRTPPSRWWTRHHYPPWEKPFWGGHTQTVSRRGFSVQQPEPLASVPKRCGKRHAASAHDMPHVFEPCRLPVTSCRCPASSSTFWCLRAAPGSWQAFCACVWVGRSAGQCREPYNIL